MLQWISKYDKNNELVLVCPKCDYWRDGYNFDNLFLPRYCESCGERLNEFKVLNQREGI